MILAKDFNHLLHDSRSARLRRLPKPKTLLSAGCAGLWYFEWIANKIGDIPKHIGVEYYTPKPQGLPSNVEWIENTAGDMPLVGDASCDMVFSGQNVEHLWPNEVVGFLLEAWRVLSPGGRLVMDSPNRDIMKQLNWSHPEHTVELTPDEAKDICTLAGFDVENTFGLWVCRDPQTGENFTQIPDGDEPKSWTVIERMLCAEDHPDSSFVWWIEATRSTRQPDRKHLIERMSEIFSLAWAERARRYHTICGEMAGSGEARSFRSIIGQSGFFLYGPYIPLPAGTFTVKFEGKVLSGTGNVIFDVVAGGKVLSQASCTTVELAMHGSISINFSLPEMTFGIEFRAQSDGNSAVEIIVPSAPFPHSVMPARSI